MRIGRLRFGRRFIIKSAIVAGTIFAVWNWGVLPVQNWVNQRETIERLESELQEAQASNNVLLAEIALLETDAEIERIARRDFGMVYPGEEAYAMLPAPRAAEDG